VNTGGVVGYRGLACDVVGCESKVGVTSRTAERKKRVFELRLHMGLLASNTWKYQFLDIRYEHCVVGMAFHF